MNGNRHKDEPQVTIKSSILDAIRQWWYPAEFRIGPPGLPPDALALAKTERRVSPNVEEPEHSTAPSDGPASNQFVAEVATCLWYLKTKHFKRDWEDDGAEDNGADDGPRVRRALGRLNRGIDALRENGIEVQDPTNTRYPQGGEGMMRPIQFQPTAGLTVEMVTETVVPIVYRNDQLIQRGEVFVAVPKEDVTTTSPPTAGTRVTDTPAPDAAPQAPPSESVARTQPMPEQVESADKDN